MEMTKEEFYEKYGDIKVTFRDYYKYSFTYEGFLDNDHRISVSIGGNADDIYRESVSSNETVSIAALDAYRGAVITGGKEIEYFYDY